MVDVGDEEKPTAVQLEKQVALTRVSDIFALLKQNLETKKNELAIDPAEHDKLGRIFNQRNLEIVIQEEQDYAKLHHGGKSFFIITPGRDNCRLEITNEVIDFNDLPRFSSFLALLRSIPQNEDSLTNLAHQASQQRAHSANPNTRSLSRDYYQVGNFSFTFTVDKDIETAGNGRVLEFNIIPLTPKKK